MADKANTPGMHNAICKAYTAKRGLDRLHRAKVNAVREQQGLPPIQGWYVKSCIQYMFLSSGHRKSM